MAGRQLHGYQFYRQKNAEFIVDFIARANPDNWMVENLEVLFFSTRLLRSDLLELPVSANLRLTALRISGMASKKKGDTPFAHL